MRLAIREGRSIRAIDDLSHCFPKKHLCVSEGFVLSEDDWEELANANLENINRLLRAVRRTATGNCVFCHVAQGIGHARDCPVMPFLDWKEKLYDLNEKDYSEQERIDDGRIIDPQARESFPASTWKGGGFSRILDDLDDAATEDEG